MLPARWLVGAALSVWLTAPVAARAETPPAAGSLPQAYKSLGQPWLTKPYLAGSLSWNREDGDRLGGVAVGFVAVGPLLRDGQSHGTAAERDSCVGCRK